MRLALAFLLIASAAFAHAGPAAAQAPSAAPQASPLGNVVAATVPMVIDMGRRACENTVAQLNIPARTVADLPPEVADPIREVFPASVVDGARIHFNVPLNDPNGSIGFLNSLAVLSMGGGLVLGLAFEDNVYLFFPEESLQTEAAAAVKILVHELVHVAQYQALGYEGYKKAYAAEWAAGRGVDGNHIEDDAYRLQYLFPDNVPAAYFAFLEGMPREALQVRLADGALAVLGSLPDAETTDVTITASGENLPRSATLLQAHATAPAQLLDPFGGPPLHVFAQADGTRLLFNEPATPNGPWLVAVGNDDGAEIVWRSLNGLISQSFGGRLHMRATAPGNAVELMAEREDSAPLYHWWVGEGFLQVPARALGIADTPQAATATE